MSFYLQKYIDLATYPELKFLLKRLDCSRFDEIVIMSKEFKCDIIGYNSFKHYLRDMLKPNFHSFIPFLLAIILDIQYPDYIVPELKYYKQELGIIPKVPNDKLDEFLIEKFKTLPTDLPENKLKMENYIPHTRWQFVPPFNENNELLKQYLDLVVIERDKMLEDVKKVYDEIYERIRSNNPSNERTIKEMEIGLWKVMNNINDIWIMKDIVSKWKT